MPNGNPEKKDLFSFLNPPRPTGFFGNFGAGLESGISTLGVSAAQTLPRLLLSDEADLADIGVASFLAALGGPIAERKTREEMERERATQALPQLLPLLDFESRQKAAQALTGVKDLQLEKPVRTPREEAMAEVLGQALPFAPTMGAKMNILAELLTPVAESPQQAMELATQVFPKDEIEREQRALARGEQVEMKQLELTDLQMEEARNAMEYRAKTFNLQVQEHQAAGFLTLMQDDRLSFRTRMTAGSQYLRKLGFNATQAEETMAEGFAPQLKLEAESMLYQRLVEEGAQWGDLTQQERELARLGGFKDPLSPEELAALKLSLRASSVSTALTTDKVFAAQFVVALQRLQMAQPNRQPGESTEQLLQRVTPQTAPDDIEILRKGGVLKKGMEFDDYATTLNTLFQARLNATDMLADTSAIDAMISITSELAKNEFIRQYGAPAGPGGLLSEEQQTLIAQDPMQLVKHLEEQYENAVPDDRIPYNKVDDILTQMTTLAGQDVSRAPEYRAAAETSASVLIPTIPSTLRAVFVRRARQGNMNMKEIENQFRIRYRDEWARTGVRPSPSLVASQFLKEIEQSVFSAAAKAISAVPTGEMRELPIFVPAPSGKVPVPRFVPSQLPKEERRAVLTPLTPIGRRAGGG